MVGQNFGKRLAKEFQRGGKKSIVLALLLLVGLGIWGPMLWRKVFPKRETAAKADTPAKANPKPESAGQQTAASPASTPSTIEWKSLNRRLEKSPLIQPLALDELVRDPFEQEWVREKTKPVLTKPVTPIPSESDPLRTLVLSAVLAGGGGSAAVINDVVYRVGQEVPENGAIRYLLKEIRQDRVFLERGGKLEELPLNDTTRIPSESVDQDK